MNHHGRKTGSRPIDTNNEEWSDITSVPWALLNRHDTDPTLADIDRLYKEPLEQDVKTNNKQDDHPFLLDSSDNSIRDSSARRFIRPVEGIHRLAQDGLRRNCVSCLDARTSGDSSTPHVIKRCRRMSFEYHADSSLDDLFESCDPKAIDESVRRLIMCQSRRRKVMLQLLLLLKCQATQSEVGVEKKSYK